MKRTMLYVSASVLLISTIAFGGKAKKGNNSFPLLQENTINTIIDVTARSVARRYDLNPDQAQIAREMIERNSWNFINEHYDTLLEVMPKLYEFRMKASEGEDPTPAEVQAVAQKLYPLIVEARNLIVSQNEKFDQYLNDKQKVKHQRDIAKMKKDFARIEKKFKRWKEGGYRPGEFAKRRHRRRRMRNINKPKTQKTLDPTMFDFWEMYVKTFIEAFQLDQGQVTLAYSVLNDMKTRANAYRQDHAREFQEVQQAIERLSKANTTQPDKKRREELAKYKKKLAKLNQPLLDMFEELKQRLMDIPTDVQRKSAQQLLSTKDKQDKTGK